MSATLLAVALVATSTTELSASEEQEVVLLKPRPRQGFFLALGTRGAYFGGSAEPVGNLGFFMGGSFTFRFGQMVNDLLGFGLQVDVGGGQSKEWAGGYGGLAAEFQVAPFAFNLAFRGAIGVAGLSIARRDSEMERDDDPSGNYGSYYTVGIIWDWFPFYDEGDSGGFAISSFLEGRILPLGDILIGGALVGVEISYFFGFGRNRLDLDVDKAYR